MKPLLKRRLIASIIVLPLIIIVWFSTVDKSFFMEGCNDCIYSNAIIAYRVFGISVYEQSDLRHSPIEMIAKYLEVPCPHHNYYKDHIKRYWGLLICKNPCYNGTLRLSGGDEYWLTEQFAEKVKKIRILHPDLAQEFYARVIVNYDREYWMLLISQLQSEDPFQFDITVPSANK